jgi:hypothetical protein
MCAVAAIPIALTLASTAVAAYGQHQQGQAQKAAANYNAKLDDYNAGLQEIQAADATERGGAAAARSLQQTARTVGDARVGFAAGNVDVSTGAPVLWQADAMAAGYDDAALIQYNAAQEARTFRGAAFNSRSSARLSRSSGRNAGRAGNIQAGTSLLAGASQVAGY